MSDLRRIFRLLPQGLRWRWWSLFPIVVLAAAIEAVAAVAVFTLLQLLSVDGANGPSRIVQSRVLQLLVGSASALVPFATAVGALYLGRWLLLLLTTYLRDRAVHATIAALSGQALQRYLQGALPSRRDTAAILQRVGRSPELIAAAGLASALQLTAEVAVVVALLALLAVSAPLPTLLAVGLTMGGLLLPAALSHRVFERWGRRENELNERLLRELSQGIGALREIRVYHRESFFMSRFRSAQSALARLQKRRSFLGDGLRLGIETGFVLILLVVVLVVTRTTNQAELMSLLGLYAYTGFRLVPSANRITLSWTTLRGVMPFARALADDIEMAEGLPTENPSPSGRVAFSRDICLSRVGFRYTDDTGEVLHDVSLTIQRGESIGIVGPSGAGKSTLLDVILGLVVPSSGTVRVDGKDIHDDLSSWQRQIGYVAQTVYLLDDTLAQNVAFGVEPGEIDRSRVIDALRSASLEKFVDSLPDGVQTELGERGSRLSGGERQRVAIARALYGNPEVLLFDEATAALDGQTEQEVTNAIGRLQGSKTVIVVAHRLSTVRDCSRIVLMSEGRIADVGTFGELLERSTEFRKLVSAADVSTS